MTPLLCILTFDCLILFMCDFIVLMTCQSYFLNGLQILTILLLIVAYEIEFYYSATIPF